MKHLKKYNESISNPQEVKVYVWLTGEYPSFREMRLQVIYDITNDHPVGFGDEMLNTNRGYTLDTFKNWSFAKDGEHRSDIKEMSAIKVGDKYYIESN